MENNQIEIENVSINNTRTSIIQNLKQLFSAKWWLIIIPAAYICFLLGVSLLGLLKLSIFNETGFTLEYITRFFTRGAYLSVLLLTFKIAFYVTVLCFVLGYPIAYLMKKVSKRMKDLIFATIFLSFWISLLVRSFTWMILLRSNGVFNKLLMGIGIIKEPIEILHNTSAVVIGMTHILLPYMILVIYSGIEKIDMRLIDAAQGLGSKPWKAFMRIFLPLSIPGIISGSLIVFVMSIGYYITPALLGGAKNTMIGVLISDQVNVVLDWNFAAAISVILLIATFFLLGISALLMKTSFMKGSD